MTLLEIGHLREVAEHYAYGDGVEGAFRRIADKIANKAREDGPGVIEVFVERPYDFRTVAFSHGHGVVSGMFEGRVDDRGAMLRISGNATFEFSDIFANPLDIGVEPGGIPYDIMGEWTKSFTAEILKDPSISQFFVSKEIY